MKIKISLCLVCILLIIPFVSAYIDAGTGGYLFSSLWSWIVGIFAVVSSIIVKLFKHTLKVYFFKIYNKISEYRLIIKIIIKTILLIILIFGLSYSFVYIYNSFTGKFIDGNSDFINVTVNTENAYDGYTLINGELINMNGTVVHNWSYWYLGIIDDNGDFYAQQKEESLKWGRYSWNGSVIWEKAMPIHHEILLTPSDTVIVLTKEVHIYNERNVEFDVMVEFDKDGNFIKQWSTWEHLKDLKNFHRLLELDKPYFMSVSSNVRKNTSIWGGNYDYYHMNAISLISNNSMDKYSEFNKGNYLISFRHGSMMFIIDKDNGSVVWKAIYNEIEQNIEGQHSVQMLPDGKLLIFDNGRYREWSRIIELNPVTLEIEWEYKSDDFFTTSQGHVQRLPNGNTLITESEDGRVFEIDSNKGIVWEWWNYETIDDIEKDSHGERKSVYRATRYDKNFIDGFLK